MAGVAAVALAAAACGSASADDRVVVSAASSLIDRLSDHAEVIEASSSGIEVELNFGGSTTLVTQVNEGAPVDILAVADRAAADAVQVEILDKKSVGVAALHLIRSREAAELGSIEDLLASDAIVAACDVSLPCGRLTDRIIEDLGIGDALEIDTREPNVRAVLSRVEQGEADYGFVYDTELEVLDDAAATGIELPASPVNERIVLLLSDGHPARTVFAELVRLERTQELDRS